MLRRLVAYSAGLACLLPAAAAAAGDPIMPLGDVRPGMACTGYSVVKGTTISSFDVRIEDVVTGDPAARAPRLLIRSSGPAVDDSGLGQGFSGSPIYCPGADGQARVAGAVSEGVGEYGNEVALATPIQAILGEKVDPPAAARSAPALLRAARPLAAPLGVGGLSPRIAELVRRSAAARRRAVYAVPAAPRAGFGVQELRPGASLAVGLASGDLTASAVGTVSYVDGDRVWGFAHPLDAVGRRSLLLQDAYVYTVISNPLGTEDGTSYKLAAPGHDLGTLTGDGLSAVVGRLGPLPARFPLRVNARDEDTGRIEVMNVQLADETAVGTPTGTSALSAVGPVALAQAAYTVLGGAPMRQSGSMCVRIELRERRSPMRFCNTYVGGGGGSAELAGAPLVADFGTAIELLDAYDVAPLHVTKVEANVKLRRGLRQAFLVGVRGPSVVRRGTTVRLRVRLRRVRGGFSTRAIRVRIPRGMPAGERELTLTGTASDQVAGGEEGTIDISDLFDLGGAGAPEGRGPTSVDELAGLIAGIGRYDGVTASFREPGGGGLDEEQGGEPPGGAEGVALRERPVLRDPELRVSGSVALPVTVE